MRLRTWLIGGVPLVLLLPLLAIKAQDSKPDKTKDTAISWKKTVIDTGS